MPGPKQRVVREHGTNACYRWGVIGNDWRNGCRCFDCTSAGVLYELKREARKARGIEPFVDNTEARNHLLWLQSQNVGLRAVAEVSGLSRTELWKIRSGARVKSRPALIAKVLAVGAHRTAPGARVDSAKTLALLEDMVSMGHTRAELAARLGYKSPKLQYGATVLRSTQDKVTKLHRELAAQRDAQREWDAARMRDYRQRSAMDRVAYRRPQAG